MSSLTSTPADAGSCWCRGAGFVVRVQDEFPYARLPYFCDCPEGPEARERFRRREREAAWEAAGVPRRYLDLTLEGSPLRGRYPDLITDLRESEDASYLLWGDYGTGKTGLAVPWLRQRCDDGYSVLFETMPDLMSRLRSSYNRRSDEDPTEIEIMEKYRTVEALVLDDVGAEATRDNDWLADRCYQIIGHRHAEELATCFTSNLSPEELGARLGSRVMWRVSELCGASRVVKITGPNLRLVTT